MEIREQDEQFEIDEDDLAAWTLEDDWSSEQLSPANLLNELRIALRAKV